MVAIVKARLAPPWGQHEAPPEPEPSPEPSPEPCPSSGASLCPKRPPPLETQGCRSVGPGGGDELPIAHRMLPGSLRDWLPSSLPTWPAAARTVGLRVVLSDCVHKGPRVGSALGEAGRLCVSAQAAGDPLHECGCSAAP